MDSQREILDSVTWWRGVPLDERRDAALGSTPEQRAHGVRRLDLWRSGILFSGGSPQTEADHLERWSATGVGEEELVTLLGEPAESLAARLPRPEWLTVIEEAWRTHAGNDDGTQGRIAAVAHDHGGHEHARAPGLGPAELVVPLLRWARDELRRRVPDLPLGHPVLTLPVETLSGMLSRVLVLELNVARVTGDLAGDTPEERFASFMDLIRDPARALALLSEYPVLARLLVTSLRNWVEVRAEFAERFLADLPRLRTLFDGSWQGLEDLTDITFGAGDTHGGGRSVALLTLSDGARLVYKPRPVDVELHFNELLRRLNGWGMRHPLRTLAVLPRPGYGWVEHVAAEPCATTDEAGRFFWRQGAYLAVFHAICGADLHLQNLIAAGEHPVFVDLEATFVGRLRAEPDPVLRIIGAVPDLLNESVLGTGLLPERIIEVDDSGWRDAEISGLAGGDGQLSPSVLPTYTAQGTDAMRLVRERMPISGTANRATLAGAPLDPLRYREPLLEGFECAYRLITRERDALLAADGPIAAFAADAVRHVPRPTSVYSRILTESMHPDVLRDSLDWEYVLETGLAGGHQGLDGRIGLLTSEQRQLAGLDVPAFRTTPGARDLHDHQGLVVRDFLSLSGMDAVHAKVRRMGPDDLRRQQWCIEASLTGLTFGTQTGPVAPARELPGQPLDTGHALRAAAALADGLLTTAVHGTDDQPPHWLSLNIVGERYWRAGPAGISLYDGVSGIALFLAHLSSLTGEQRYRAVAERIAGHLADALTSPERTAQSRIALSIGGFGDLGGAVYTLTHLAALWDESALLDAASALVPELAGRFADDRELDLVQGTAGAALALVALDRMRPDERVVDALRIAGGVLAKAATDVSGGAAWCTAVDPDRPLLGLSHGASGFALALARIAEVTGEEHLYRLCEKAISFERHRLAPDRGNWPDLRSIVPEGSFMNAWCHGAAGIGLARAELLRVDALAGVRGLLTDDLRVATETVRGDLAREGVYTGLGNDSLCHGDMGLVAALLAAGPGWQEGDVLGPRVARAVADRALAGDARPGVPMGVTTPGLMTGTAGIGYGLLRAAAPDRVPEVLTLAAPVVREGGR